MADYREISQQYAQGGIKAGIILNGGAAIAVLSQGTGLISAGLAGSIRFAMLCWILGTFFAATTWVLAFSSTRYVDKSEREPTREQDHLWWSDFYMRFGLLTVGASLIAYLLGAGVLAWSFGGAEVMTVEPD